MPVDARPWKSPFPPRRILAIRLQAMGDTMITLPYLQELRSTLPAGTILDFLTREEVAPIPRNIDLFDNVYAIGGGRDPKKIWLHTLLLLPRLLTRRYDLVIDLQHNKVSDTVRKTLRPTAWSAFDRFSPIAAGERTRLTIEAAGLGPNGLNSHFRLKGLERGRTILEKNGWNGVDPLVVLNPAGAFTTRNWPTGSYIRFARLWLEHFPGTRFLVLGISPIKEKAAFLKKELGDRLFDLVDQTSPLEAFAVLQHTTLVLSEDSGLMHMAWISGIPTLVLFGGTRSDWSRPLGDHSSFLDSSDLPCGNCMAVACRYGDVHCLTRYTPEMVLERALSLTAARFLDPAPDPYPGGRRSIENR